MTSEGVAATEARIVLGNTYHLMLRPRRRADCGTRRAAPLHELPCAILTDAGGFQVMSLAARRTISEAGATFRSHLDGSLYELTPERSVAIQHLLGADVTMALDECTLHPSSCQAVESATGLTLRWAERSRRAFVERPGHGVFGIVQRGIDSDLRRRGRRGVDKQLDKQPFDGRRVIADLVIAVGSCRLNSSRLSVDLPASGAESARLAQLATQHHHHRVVPQLVVLDQILIAQRSP